MKKIVNLIFVSFILISCGKNLDTKSTFDEKQNDSIKQVKNDSIIKLKVIQDSLLNVKIFEEEKASYLKTIDLRKKHIGFKYEYPKSTDFILKYGSPETLNGTDNNKWIVYFPKGDFTIVSDKKTNTFQNICSGKNSNLKFDASVELSKHIGKKMKYEDFSETFSSIKYGQTEKLGMTNCVNKDCVEYFLKGNFTIVAFYEFNDSGDFVTVKKIAIGKVPRLIEY